MFNLIDVLVTFLIVYFVWQGYRTGLVGGLLNIFSTLVSFVIATTSYPTVGRFLENQLKLGENTALVVGFALILIGLEIVLNLVFSLLYSKVAPLYKTSKTIAKVDKILGILPSVAVGLFLVSLFMLLTLILPVRPWLRDPIQDSWWGINIVSKGTSWGPGIEKLLNRLPYKSLVYLLTPSSPSNKDSQSLNFPRTLSLKPDPEAEKEMFNLVNKERKAQGLGEVVVNEALRDVGRAYCLDMFKRGYFSHYTPEGKSPFDRIDAAGIDYLAAGENLAYAPSVAIAHQGLMNSPGHRANILRKEFGKLGVGVIDGGLNGKMFCQEFTN